MGKYYSFDDYLVRSRQIMLTEPITDITTSRIIRELGYLASVSSKEPIELIISSPGGSVNSGLAIVDFIQYGIRCPVVGIATGMVASMASIIFISCDERKMLPHAKFLLHGVSFGYDGNVSLANEIFKEVNELQDTLKEILWSKTNLKEHLDKHEIDYIFSLQKTYNAKECLKYNICDDVISEKRK